MKKHHNQQRSESPVQAGDLILIKDNTAKSFKPLYKGNYRVVKVHGNNVEIRDYRGNISMVHITDVKKITLMEQVADEYEQLGKEGRFSKKCIPRGYIPDFNGTTIHQNQNQPIKPIKQQDPTEDTTTPVAPTEVEGPPSSHLRSKMKQQPISNEQGQPERNPTPMDLPERNPAEIEINSVDIAPKNYSWMRLAKFLSYPKKIIEDPVPVSLPYNFVVNFMPFHPAKKQPSPYLVHKYPKLGIVQILSCPTLFYCPTSMARPKANNDHLFLRKTQISPSRNLFIQRACEIHGLDQNNMNFESF